MTGSTIANASREAAIEARLGHLIETEPNFTLPVTDSDGSVEMRRLLDVLDEIDAEIEGAEAIMKAAQKGISWPPS